MIKAIFLDFYGTVVREDEKIIASICTKIQQNASTKAPIGDIAQFWWQQFSKGFRDEYGDTFQTQRALGLRSLEETLKHYESFGEPEEWSQPLLEYWKKPYLYEDAAAFLQQVSLPICVVSNIDRSDVMAAIRHNALSFDWIVTSEDARAYKPRPEMFQLALQQAHVAPEEVLHVGDSVMSDVGGAAALGIPVAWINRFNRPTPEDPKPDFEISKLTEIFDIISHKFN